MTTSAITSTLTSSTTSTSLSSSLSLTSSDFLTLLLTELENQNPLEPTSTSEMTSLYASLAQISQTEDTNTALTELSDSLASLSGNQALSYLNKTITYLNDSSTEVSDTVTGITYEDGATYLTTEGGDSVALSDVLGVS